MITLLKTKNSIGNLKVHFMTLLKLSILYVVLSSSNLVYAQGVKGYSPSKILFEIAPGVRTYKINSDIDKIQGLEAAHGGVSVGLTFFNQKIQIPVRAGLYQYGIEDKRTIDLIEVEVNFNPSISYLLKGNDYKFNVYPIAGVSYQSRGFRGTYIAKEDRRTSKRRKYEEPLIGKVNSININYGLGVQYKVVDNYSSMYLFAEGYATYNLATSTTDDVLKNTHTSNHSQFNIGLRFGKN